MIIWLIQFRKNFYRRKIYVKLAKERDFITYLYNCKALYSGSWKYRRVSISNIC